MGDSLGVWASECASPGGANGNTGRGPLTRPS
jgi:hypothetical protein